MKKIFKRTTLARLASVFCTLAVAGTAATNTYAAGGWIKGDFHTHTKMCIPRRKLTGWPWRRA